MMTTRALCRHWKLGETTIRAYVESGRLRACRVNRSLRFDWNDVWALERGPLPRGALAARYRTALLTRRELADALAVSLRTLDRLVERGLPTRNVGVNVRFNPHDAADWLERHAGVDSHSLASNLAALHGRAHNERRFAYGAVRANGADPSPLTLDRRANTPPSGPAAPRRCGRRARDGDRP